MYFSSGVIECEEPMDKVHDKIGTWRVKQGGKPSHTTFERVSFNGDTSVVKCMFVRLKKINLYLCFV